MPASPAYAMAQRVRELAQRFYKIHSDELENLAEVRAVVDQLRKLLNNTRFDPPQAFNEASRLIASIHDKLNTVERLESREEVTVRELEAKAADLAELLSYASRMFQSKLQQFL